jgi:hypothetical protein
VAPPPAHGRGWHAPCARQARHGRRRTALAAATAASACLCNTPPCISEGQRTSFRKRTIFFPSREQPSEFSNPEAQVRGDHALRCGGRRVATSAQVARSSATDAVRAPHDAGRAGRRAANVAWGRKRHEQHRRNRAVIRRSRQQVAWLFPECVLRAPSYPFPLLPRRSLSIPLLCASCALPSESKFLASFAAVSSLTSSLDQPGRYRWRSIGCFQGASSSGSPCCVQVRLAVRKACLQLSRFGARVLPSDLPCAAAPARSIARDACPETPLPKGIFSSLSAYLCAECSRRGCRRWCLQQRH